ncbi:Ig-like domain-containing protein [Pontibacter mangrovi]|uniref:SbsA Ig-like domain-containing protein n=1 Tax=Pontibacter mangrovi TaxID=2589816 RepID=A0A501WBW0_9BACT|nr:Ig-like domain-containing domain [Pontibacter mangrovi]TPE45554.1 hypothetical protein FJM65_05895 [Pontibacter mangrovi]
MKLIQILISAAALTAMASCATQNPPEGGPRDEEPPKLLKSTPADQQLNVKTKTVVLEFDEEVQQNTLNKELLITPNINNPYKVIPDKRTLTLEFEEPLQDSTTFTFNFRQGITDITEKNKAQNLQLSFSTGSYIDSSRVSGTVVDLMTQTPEKEALVVLYRTDDTLSIRKNRPYYLTNADAQGNYSLQNVREGSYRMYALVDKNNNSYYDNEEEKIGYLAEPIIITFSTDTVKLQTVRIDTKKPILLKREKYSDRFIAGYNEGIQDFYAVSEAGKDTLMSKVSADGKDRQLFKTEKFAGGKTILAAVDSSGNISTDTLEIAFEGKRPATIKGAALKVLNSQQTSYSVGQEVTLELETPVKITKNSPITLMGDTVVLQQLKYPEEVKLDETKTELRFNLPNLGRQQQQVTVVLDSTAIQPLQGEPLSMPQLQLGIAEGGGTGNLKGDIKTEYKSYTIQLLNDKYKVVKESGPGNSYRFKNVAPGTYYLRVLIDENNNGKWDKADPEFKKAPEPVYLLPNTVEVRANWDVEDLDLTF